jgi:hypothetical protein
MCLKDLWSDNSLASVRPLVQTPVPQKEKKKMCLNAYMKEMGGKKRERRGGG